MPGQENADDYEAFNRFVNADTILDPDPLREVSSESLAARLRSIEEKLSVMDRTLRRQEFNIQETRRAMSSVQSAIADLGSELSRQAAAEALKNDGHEMPK